MIAFGTRAVAHRPQAAAIPGDDRSRCDTRGVPEPRFLSLPDVAEVLNISAAQAYALVRNGELPAIQIGGRRQWRVERTALETYISDAYERTRDFVRDHPFTGAPE
jgi:excisionase family DNA binding protein